MFTVYQLEFYPFLIDVLYKWVLFSIFIRRVYSSAVQASTMPSRSVVQSVLSVEQDEGVGARVRRSVGRHEVCCVLWKGDYDSAAVIFHAMNLNAFFLIS